MSEPTAEQAAAIEARGPGIVVSAGAGSGKTRVLVDRYIRRLSEASTASLVAVTFTEAAAAEMRERVRKALAADPSLHHHLPDLDDAPIGTIHSLCLRILRENPVEAAIDPEFSVLGEDESQFEIATAVSDALEAAANARASRALPLFEIGEYSLRSGLQGMVGSRDAASAAFEAMGETPEDWFEHAQALVTRMTEEAVATFGVSLIDAIEEFLSLPCSNPADKMAAQIDDVRERFRGVREILAPDLLRLLQKTEDQAASHTSWFGRLTRGVGQKPNWDPPDLARAKDLCDELKSLSDALLRAAPVWNDDDPLAIDVLWQLKPIFEDACARYARRKLQLRALDFLDLELEAVRLLRGHPRVRNAYRARFTEVMVDEFQDTNELQVELVRLLTGQPEARETGPTLFVVGDPKQSIYKFRGADVSAFLALQDSLVGPAGPLPLARSFRTHAPLVETCNAFFAAVFDGSATPMQLMAGRAPDGPPEALAHLTILEAPRHTVEGNRVDMTDLPRVEASLLARHIAGLLDSGLPVWDREARVWRPVRPGDIALLFRRFTEVHTFEHALAREGLPAEVRSGSGFFRRQEVMDLVNVLAWLAEPGDQVALAGVLRSPLFAIDDATLVLLHHAHRFDLFRALEHPPEDLEPAVAGRCAHAHAVLARLREMARFAPADELLQTAVIETALEAAWTAVPGGDQAVANIRKLIGLARTLAGRSLDELVQYLVERREDYTREAQGVVLAEDAIQLMTVHGAKGLEFPVVVIPEAHHIARTPDSVAAIRWRPSEGVACKLQKLAGETSSRMTGYFRALYALEDVEEEQEYWRLLYVAMTRAADYVIVSGSPYQKQVSWFSRVFESLADAKGVQHIPADPFDRKAYKAAERSTLPPIPPETSEVSVAAPLIERPRVIPIRSSTPATALRDVSSHHPFLVTDGLGTVRGKVAHRAIELRFGQGQEPALRSLVLEAQELPLPPATIEAIVTDVSGYLQGLAESPLAARFASGEPRFEVPFAFDWDGVPVHGVIDLLLHASDGWHVVDFKTDAVAADPFVTARPYLPQLGLYGLAVQAATGERPSLSLAFLRTGQLLELEWPFVFEALARTRLKVDAGAMLDTVGEPVAQELEA